jgi:hypothetical protein
VKRVPNIFTMCPPLAAAIRRVPAAAREEAEGDDKDDEEGACLTERLTR